METKLETILNPRQILGDSFKLYQRNSNISDWSVKYGSNNFYVLVDLKTIPEINLKLGYIENDVAHGVIRCTFCRKTGKILNIGIQKVKSVTNSFIDVGMITIRFGTPISKSLIAIDF